MTDLTPNHPAVYAAERAATRWMEDRELETDLDGTAYMLTAALPHLTADDLRNTPAGRDLIREGIAAARNLEWMQPRMTPGGHIFNPGIPGDEMRAVREDALARVATMTYPSRFVSERTLELSRATLARTHIDQGVRRAIVDAQSELEEALASRRAFPAARP